MSVYKLIHTIGDCRFWRSMIAHACRQGTWWWWLLLYSQKATANYWMNKCLENKSTKAGADLDILKNYIKSTSWSFPKLLARLYLTSHATRCGDDKSSLSLQRIQRILKQGNLIYWVKNGDRQRAYTYLSLYSYVHIGLINVCTHDNERQRHYDTIISPTLSKDQETAWDHQLPDNFLRQSAHPALLLRLAAHQLDG